jgi:CHASE2 domain-containing sensor protein/two-component sensor histidine kinase
MRRLLLNLRRWLVSEIGWLALVLVVLALGVSGSGVLVRGDHLILDIGQRLRPGKLPEDVLIIAIDESSLVRLGRWPWAREVHAQLLDIVCAGHPKAVGLDIAFAEPAADRQADQQLASAIKRCGNVLLPMLIETPRVGGQLLESPPVPVLAEATAGLGRVGVRLDEDGIARSVDLWEGVGDPAWPLMAQELLRVAGQLPPGLAGGPPAYAGREASDALVRREPRRVAFVGPPESVPRVSYADVLSGRMGPDIFAGKIVLIGVTAVGLGDFLPTPVSALKQPMPGVEVLANVMLGIRENTLIREMPGSVSLLISALLAVIPLIWLPRLMPLPGLLASVAWIFVLIGIFVGLPNFAHVHFSPSGALLAALSAFPLWSWRRLEAARRHLDQELIQLQRILPQSSALPVQEAVATRRLGFEQRIAWIQASQQAVLGAKDKRNEALAFISHDLRTPLAAAIQYLESEAEADPAYLLQGLRRAHHLAQAFLSLAQAEMFEASQMHELDLASVLHQAADELYPLARRKMLTIDRRIPDEPVWIKGSFELLLRATVNLLQNAFEHASERQTVALGIDCESGSVEFWVKNESAGLPPELTAKLFQRFGKGEGGAVLSGSTGLGLYFVRTVAEKHGGQAGVNVLSDGWIRFWVRLPVDERG